MDRSRVHTWCMPEADRIEAAHHMSGLDIAKALLSGRLSMPIASTLDFAFDEVEQGRVTLVGRPQEAFYNYFGLVHGGYQGALLATAAGVAVQTVLPPGTSYVTSDFSMHLFRPVTVETGPITAVGTVSYHGRHSALAQASLYDDDGKCLAQATSGIAHKAA